MSDNHAMMTDEELGLLLTLDVLRKRVEDGQLSCETEEYQQALGLVESLMHRIKGHLS